MVAVSAFSQALECKMFDVRGKFKVTDSRDWLLGDRRKTAQSTCAYRAAVPGCFAKTLSRCVPELGWCKPKFSTLGRLSTFWIQEDSTKIEARLKLVVRGRANGGCRLSFQVLQVRE